jgi:hypothetical protein
MAAFYGPGTGVGAGRTPEPRGTVGAAGTGERGSVGGVAVAGGGLLGVERSGAGAGGLGADTIGAGGTGWG